MSEYTAPSFTPSDIEIMQAAASARLVVLEQRGSAVTEDMRGTFEMISSVEAPAAVELHVSWRTKEMLRQAVRGYGITHNPGAVRDACLDIIKKLERTFIHSPEHPEYAASVVQNGGV